MRLAFLHISDSSRAISIHASHAGCDIKSHIAKGYNHIISIHASHAGCDVKSFKQVLPTCLFQSTHPMRDATGSVSQLHRAYSDFNPRIPCGMRRQFRYCYIYCTPFQSTHPMRDATNPPLHSFHLPDISIHASHAGCDL